MPEKIQDVNIEYGDDVSRMLYEASKLTHSNRPGLVRTSHDSFSGFRAIDGSYFGDISNYWMQLGLDGVGTKVEVSERLRSHSPVAHDLFAMICDDASVRGGEPLAVGSILDVRQLNEDDYTKEAIQQLAQGYYEAAERANVVILNGEVAELGNRIGGHVDALFSYERIRREGLRRKRFNYNWGGVVLWLAHKERELTGQQIQTGDALVGLAEHGFRSNGVTDVRKIMRKEHGRNWHDDTVKSIGDLTLGELVQKPSIIYCSFINELTGGYDINKKPKAEVHGIAHITGGGQPSKLGRMLEPSGHGAVIFNPLSPPPIMLEVQKMGKYSDRKAYGKWHMGPGMIIATPQPEQVMVEARKRGIAAKNIGVVTEEPGIRIKNMGTQQVEEYLTF
jgi:phosphoribosylformylglycinamidine cyclo-ligase